MEQRARAHKGEDDKLVKVAPLLEMVPNWKDYLVEPISEVQEKIMIQHQQTVRPLGGEDFIAKLESILGKILRKGKPGPKPKAKVLN